MLTRCSLAAALLFGCAPASLPASGAAHASDAVTAARAAEPGIAAGAPRVRRVARLSPPFAGAGTTRRSPGGDMPSNEALAALAATP